MLNNAFNSIYAHLMTDGDGLVAGGYWHFVQQITTYNVGVVVMNANNHQITWGVMGAAMQGLSGYMRTGQMYGAATFDVWDGVNQVATGVVMLLPRDGV